MTNTIHAQGGICPSLSVFFMRHVFNKGNRCVPIGTLKGLFKRFNPFLEGKKKESKTKGAGSIIIVTLNHRVCRARIPLGSWKKDVTR